jgi:uncharacterized protein (TIGR03086 family)
VDPCATLQRAQDGFDAMLASVPEHSWDAPSACPDWTLRDVTGHVIWSLEQLRHWATGQTYECATGAPGAPRPAEMAGTDPVATWRAVRTAASDCLTADALDRTVNILAFGNVPLATVIPVLALDHLVHTWDIGYPLEMQVRLDPGLVTICTAWAREHNHAIRRPGLFGPELSPPSDANEQVRLMAFLGRKAWKPVNAR